MMLRKSCHVVFWWLLADVYHMVMSAPWSDSKFREFNRYKPLRKEMTDREYLSRYEMPERVSSEYFPQYKSRPVNPAYSFYAPAEGMSWYGKQAEPWYDTPYARMANQNEPDQVRRQRDDVAIFKEADYYPDPEKGDKPEGWDSERVEGDRLRSLLQDVPEEHSTDPYSYPTYPPQDGLDILQKIGMRLTDLTTEREDGENDEKVLEDEEVTEESATTELMSDNEARSLLRQLEEAESMREGNREGNSEGEHNKERLDMNQLAAMFDDTEQNEEEEEPKDKKKAERVSPKDVPTRDEMKDDLLDLMYSQNLLLMQAIQRIPYSQLQSTEAIQQIQDLINEATMIQTGIDSILSQLKELGVAE